MNNTTKPNSYKNNVNQKEPLIMISILIILTE
jgi:hypothetical protein